MRQLAIATSLCLHAVAIAKPLPATRAVVPERAPALSAAMQRFVSVPGGVIAIRGVRLVDGTGAPARADRTVVVKDKLIVSIGGPELPIPRGAQILEKASYTLLPGLVGMHNHLFYMGAPRTPEGEREPLRLVSQMSFSAPRLYLAMGVTTMRTAGSVEPFADLNLKRLIDQGELVGPRLDVTAPYLEGGGSRFVQMHQVDGAAEARAFVRYWAGLGATSVKLYTNISRAEARAGIEEAHALGLKVTGHLCSISYAEAAALGIDNIEHGFFADTALDRDKAPDTCPATAGRPTLERRSDPAHANSIIDTLVRNRVALTSTLPVFEQLVSNRPPPSAEALATLSPPARDALLKVLATRDATRDLSMQAWLRRGMALEKRFVEAGGLLLSGPDPTGNGGVIPGFGDVRGIALLVEAGLSFEQAVRVATLNGAEYLDLDRVIGSIEPGKRADLILIQGNPTVAASVLENVETVFKDGVGFDSVKLRRSVAERYGQY